MESMTEDSIEARRWLARKNFIEALRQLTGCGAISLTS